MTHPLILDTLLLLALPASGKSEVRRYMMHVPRTERIDTFHLGDTVQLDDFPYVHFMRQADDALAAFGDGRHFYSGSESGFADGRDWGTLLRLVAGDFDVVRNPDRPLPPPDAALLLSRIDKARLAVGAPAVFASLSSDLRSRLVEKLAPDAKRLIDEQFATRPSNLDGKTIVIEFARGGPEGSTMPLPEPHGYRYSLAQLGPAVLSRAAILYIWVSPQESRRKNLARADPDDPGSILHHSAPESVMRNNYGCDDIEWLIENSTHPGTVEVVSEGKTFHLPLARFDNRVDRTSFVRDDPATWPKEAVRALHNGLREALGHLWTAWIKR